MNNVAWLGQPRSQTPIIIEERDDIRKLLENSTMDGTQYVTTWNRLVTREDAVGSQRRTIPYSTVHVGSVHVKSSNEVLKSASFDKAAICSSPQTKPQQMQTDTTEMD